MLNLKGTATEEDEKAIGALSNEERANIIAEINAKDPFTFFDSVEGKEGKEIVCPFCGSGSGKNHTGIRPTLKSRVWLYHCFACDNFKGTLLSIIAAANNLDTHGKDFLKVLAIGANILGINIYSPADGTKLKKSAREKFQPKIMQAAPTNTPTKQKIKLPERHSKAKNDFISFIEKQGGKWRGITLENWQKNNCGFCQKVYFPAAQKELPAIVIPNDLNGLYYRSIEGKFHKNDKPTATTTIFIPNADNFDIVVVEGQINGLSILEAIPTPNFGIIASSGTSGEKNVLAKIEQLQAAGKKIRIIMAGDNDANNAGQNFNARMLETLKQNKIPACSVDITKTPNMDLNNVLQQEDGEIKLAQMVNDAVSLAQVDLERAAAELEKESALKEKIEEWTQEKGASSIENLRQELSENEKQLDAFNDEKEDAVTRINEIETFDRQTVFSEENLKAAAVVKTFFPEIWADYKGKVRKYKQKNEDGVILPDLFAILKEYENQIKKRHSDLLCQKTKLQAELKTKVFFKENAILNNLVCPEGYEISADGVGKIEGTHIKKICNKTIMASKKIICVYNDTIKIVLTFKNCAGVWKSTPPTEKAKIANSRQIIELANSDFPVTSQNAGDIVSFLYEFLNVNESKINHEYEFKNFGWQEYNGQKFFLDPRQENTVEDDGKKYPAVCNSQSQFARSLKKCGSLEKWKEIYNKVKKYPVARAMVAANFVAPILELINERAFWIHLFSKTRAGKTTALKFGTSAIGNPAGIIKNFNSTMNGIQGVAAERNGYPLPLDEWQAASPKMKDQVCNLIHNTTDGTARTKMNKDSTVRENENWQTVIITTGETPILKDVSFGGEFTRMLQIAAPSPILPPDLCNEIHNLIKGNYGLVFPLYLKTLEDIGADNLREMYSNLVEKLKAELDENKNFCSILPEYLRYISAITLAACILDRALDIVEPRDEYDCLFLVYEILKLVPTIEEIDDTSRAKDMVLGFIAQKSAHFVGTANYNKDYGRDIYGKKGVGNEAKYFYITTAALKLACKESGFDYNHVVKILTDDGFFVPSAKVEKGYKKPRLQVLVKINGLPVRCCRIKASYINNCEQEK